MLIAQPVFPVKPSHISRLARFRRGATRGFTLAEMLIVIAMIGVLVAAASPVFISLMRDRRVNRAAMSIIDIYRLGRARALGRGTAVDVIWDTTGSPLLTMREAVVAGTLEPSTLSCTGTNWTVGSTNSVYRMKFDPLNGMYERASVLFKDSAGAAQTHAEICFTPRGRTFMATTGVFAQMTGISTFEVTNNVTNFKRIVFLLPNGVGRMNL